MQIPKDVLQLFFKGIQETWMIEGYITALLAECHCDLFIFFCIGLPASHGDRDAKQYLMTCSRSVVGNNIEIHNPHDQSITGPVETYTSRPTSEWMWVVV